MVSKGSNNFITVVFDSCWFDSLVAANARTLLTLGDLEKLWSYASWTAPSHHNLLMALMPHTRPTMVYASEWAHRQSLRPLSLLASPFN